MKISYNWLQDYVKTSTSPQDLANRFHMTSSEVESITELGPRLGSLRVGRIIKIQLHPNADKLKITTIDLGHLGKKTIICGAPNVALDQHVVVALPGTTIYPLKGEPITIQEASIRGEASQGMLCSAEEIGLPLASEGILVLPSTLKPGSLFAESVGLNDVILDLEITPNRPDLLSYYGLAHEVTAFEKRHLLEIPIHSLDERPHSEESPFNISIEDSLLCPRYSAISLEIPQIFPSPLWLQLRLAISGIRPINAVVDITNYVMLEMGQPLHAFDLDHLGKPATLTVRASHKGEKLTTLDQHQRILPGGDIIIANGQNIPIDLAGIMGGEDTSIFPSTRHILLQAATFSGSQIRKTSRALGLRTEASTRYEKGLDTEMTIAALKRAVYLLQEIVGARITSALTDLYSGRRLERPRIHLSFSRIQQVLGVHISASETKTILQHLGFQIPSLTKSSFEVIPPSWRKDITIPEDVMEELIRIWGFDRIPSTLPIGQISAPEINQFYEDKNTIRQALASWGMHECVHLSLISAASLQKVNHPLEGAICLPNPLSSEAEYLIPTHLPQLLNTIAEHNQRYPTIQLFEIGHLFSPPHTEQETLSLLLRTDSSVEKLFAEAKAVIQRIVQVIKLEPALLEYTPSSAPHFQTATALSLNYNGQSVGEIGLLSAQIVANYKIRSAPAFVFSWINLDVLLKLTKTHHVFHAPSPFPSIERDITLLVARTLPAESVIKILQKNPSTILSQWEITTIYQDKPLPPDKKSITIHFVYNAGSRTLEDNEVQKDQQRLTTLFQHLPASIKE